MKEFSPGATVARHQIAETDLSPNCLLRWPYVQLVVRQAQLNQLGQVGAVTVYMLIIRHWLAFSGPPAS